MLSASAGLGRKTAEEKIAPVFASQDRRVTASFCIETAVGERALDAGGAKAVACVARRRAVSNVNFVILRRLKKQVNECFMAEGRRERRKIHRGSVAFDRLIIDDISMCSAGLLVDLPSRGLGYIYSTSNTVFDDPTVFSVVISTRPLQRGHFNHARSCWRYIYWYMYL